MFPEYLPSDPPFGCRISGPGSVFGGFFGAQISHPLEDSGTYISPCSCGHSSPFMQVHNPYMEHLTSQPNVGTVYQTWIL